ncbi:Putative Holin-X, holin superfamily III [Halogranum amylolyticum]|uniref:Putative Holin-X, holin superfamily III n=1 Tax=Halogranum amylolyticum TaxID=660520 RepID=A0A1H8R3I5_9EURY|nr:phage holin family protein [Halogranum amylolyticum]SEO60930.1 Putative Holin-X, holin superfamily III [Halogranum amylolyticum]
MPSSDLSTDDVREIAREESRNAVRAELRSLGYGVVGLVVGLVGFPLLLAALFSGNPALAAVVVFVIVAVVATLLW